MFCFFVFLNPTIKRIFKQLKTFLMKKTTKYQKEKWYEIPNLLDFAIVLIPPIVFLGIYKKSNKAQRLALVSLAIIIPICIVIIN